MHSGPAFQVVVLACAILAAGALTRLLARRLDVPYTVAMLVLGGVAGFVLPRYAGVEVTTPGTHLDQVLTPAVIIFVFLPALVFESATSVDHHAFWNERGALGLLAIPALIVNTGVMAGVMMILTRGSWDWSLQVALVFGALISATDPVAVVALLREVGAPKRLGVLIEGESLLNDGTAIVLFGVLLGLMTGSAESLSVLGTVGRFAWIVLGGAGVGLGLAWIITRIIARTFNDALVEISLTLVLAYGAMLIAEGGLHVSGVIAVVLAGLWVGGRGRTSISPEVVGALHHVWELLAYVANTLIFFLVGYLISDPISSAGLADLLLVLGAFVAVVSARFLATFAFQPLMRRLGAGVSWREATVMAWGGLRGAVSLALALVVCQHDAVGDELRRQILLVTAGVVLLTILLNGTTIRWLLARLGFDKRSPSDRLSALIGWRAALSRVLSRVNDVSGARDLRALDWAGVRAELVHRMEQLGEDAASVKAEVRATEEAERVVGLWRQALRLEREAYWGAFAEGTLGARAVQLLTLEVDKHLDRLAAGELEAPTWRSAPVERGPRWRRLADVLWGRLPGNRLHRLALRYDLARGETAAAERVLLGLVELEASDPDGVSAVKDCYRRFLHQGKERIEEMRANLPELVHAIELRLADRIALNLEREEVSKLLDRGAIDAGEGAAAMADIEGRMKRLRSGRVALRTVAELVSSSQLFEGVDVATLETLAHAAREHVLAPGDVIMRQGEQDDAAVYVVVRGALHVLREAQGSEQLVEVFGGGDVFGEMEYLTGGAREATVRAATSATVVEIDRKTLDAVTAAHPHLLEELWAAFARHAFDNAVRHRAGFEHLGHDERVAWFALGELDHLSADAPIEQEGAWLFLYSGDVSRDGERLGAPALVARSDAELRAGGSGARIARLPEVSRATGRHS
jgi:NhaP-type Na+/H+ or K+/H+ antiporter